MILCTRNNKRYFGQSKNISRRLSQHKSKLRRNIHEIPELQRDFNLYGEQEFEFSCIFCHKDCTLEERVGMEMEFIGRFFNLCYNKDLHKHHKKENNPFWGKTHSEETRELIRQIAFERQKQSPQLGIAIMLDNVTYSSISQASKETNHSRDTIRRWLKDPKNTRCVEISTDQPRNT